MSVPPKPLPRLLFSPFNFPETQRATRRPPLRDRLDLLTLTPIRDGAGIRPINMLTQTSNEYKMFGTNSNLDRLELIAQFCSLSNQTDDRGTHAGKKGPLQYATWKRLQDEKQGWENPGNGLVLDPAIRRRPGRFDRPLANRTYFLRAHRTELSMPLLSRKGLRCVYRYVND